MDFASGLHTFLPPLMTALAGLAVGVIFERIVLAKLHRLSTKTRWNIDEIIIKALRGKMIYLFILAGLYGATLGLPIKATYLNIVHKFLQIIAIFIVTTIGSGIAIGMVRTYTQRETGFLPSVSIFTNLARAIVLGIGVLISLQALGISITPILTALGVGGLAVALALQDTLSNLFSGLQLIAARQFKPGDYIRLNTGEEGFVTDIAWRSTTIRLLSNSLVIIPNATLAGAVITNFQEPTSQLSITVEVTVAYGSDLVKVEQVTIEVAKAVVSGIPGGVADFEPAIRFSALTDFGVKLAISLRVQEFTDQFMIKHELIKSLHQRYLIEEIEFSNPVRSILEKERS